MNVKQWLVNGTLTGAMTPAAILAISASLLTFACGSDAPNASDAKTDQPAAAQPSASQPPATAPNPSNELPFGRMDQPMADAVVNGGTVIASGWAVDDSAVREVRLYIDSHFRVATKLTVPRADLTGALPSYMHGNNIHGWATELDLGTSPAAHTILAQAVDDQGATHDIGSITVTVAAAKP